MAEINNKKLTKCTGCGANIFFVTSKSGKYVPLNAEIEIADGNKILWQDEINGFKRLAEGKKGYSSHFSTCPDADNFRRTEMK